MSKQDEKLMRILDANINRALEGLRVCEDIMRFTVDSKPLTMNFRQLRHQISDMRSVISVSKLAASRCVADDVAKKSHPDEIRRKGVQDLLIANLQRSKESVRVLEEVVKAVKVSEADKFKKIRFKLYEIEKKSLKSI